jgi:hypothetical protein
MKLIYAQGFNKSERLDFKPVIFNNIIQSFRTIAEAMGELGIEYEFPDNEVSHSLRALAPYFVPYHPPFFAYIQMRLSA